MNADQIVIGAIVILASIIAIYFSFRDRYTDLAQHPPESYDGSLRLTLPTIESSQYQAREDYWKARYPGSKEFTKAFEETIGPNADFCFHAKIVGINHANQDGTRRGPAIKKCNPLDVLVLDPDPNNPADPFAIAVKRTNRSQLGYLEWRVARDIRRDANRLWIAVFKCSYRSEGGAVIGADIILVRLKADIPRE